MIYYNYPPYYFPQNVNMQNRNFKNTRNQNLNTRKNNQGPVQSSAQNPFQNPSQSPAQNLFQNSGQRSAQKTVQFFPQEPICHANNKDNNSKDDKVLFEILGIKLYSDDILLLCLIFFLYNEGVQDQYLFIALILLLLS